MATSQIIIVVAGLLIVAIGALAYVLLAGSARKKSQFSGLMAGESVPEGFKSGQINEKDLDGIAEQNIKKEGKKKKDDLNTRLFKAGFFSQEDKQWFYKFRMTSLFVGAIAFPLLALLLTKDVTLIILMLFLGMVNGYVAVPSFWLDREIKKREEETLYYLPLVIEQIAIGVSSSLDIGPCIMNIVDIADERDTHNPVTEMFVSVQKLIRAGLNLEDGLTEVSEACGISEVKHAFMFLGQCSKHGGEISKQLQELGNAVMMQRQTAVEEKITALPVKATGPLCFVFIGFFALLGSGLVVRINQVFTF